MTLIGLLELIHRDQVLVFWVFSIALRTDFRLNGLYPQYNRSEGHFNVQSNLDYPDSLGLYEIVWIIKK